MSEQSRFEVEFTDEAEKHYDALDDNMTRRANAAVERLTENPFFGPNIVKLKGELQGQYRYRVGSYRIVYSVDQQRRVVTVRGIFRRGRAYR
ncbi:MAG: type II toxin-antitoxin system RelE/ParE family toxin [Acidobacteria bacterium]|nr:type II toxin-antitoxin system RelE/ParE family toxin [Acidobacteriota bacterium]